MKKPNEILTDAINDYALIKEKNEVLKGSGAIIEKLKTKPFRDWNIEELARAGGQLAIYLFNIGDMVAESVLDANSAYIYRKWKYTHSYKALRAELDKVKDAEMGATIDTGDEYEVQLKTQYNADVLKSYYQNCERLVSFIQSMMKHAENEQKKSNFSQTQNDGRN